MPRHHVSCASGHQQGNVGLHVDTRSAQGCILENRKRKTCQCFHYVLLIKILQPGELPLSCAAVCGLSDKVGIMKTNSQRTRQGRDKRSADRAGVGAVWRAGTPSG